MKLLRVLGDRAVAVGVVVAGMVVLLLGWVGVSGTAYPAEQIPFLLSGGLFGAVLIGIGATAWLSSDLHDEWRKLDRVEELLREMTEGSVLGQVPGQAPPEPPFASNGSSRAKAARS